MEATLSTGGPAPDLLAEATEVYAAAFGQPPYHEGPEQAAAFSERVVRYARTRSGFRFVTVRGDAGRLVAIALAVLARPGDWWRDNMAAPALDPAATDRWLGELCLEVVHVAVQPTVQRQGYGRLAHDLLISGAPAPTAILSCHRTAPAAVGLYTGRGWQQLGALPPDGEALLFGRDL